MGSLESILALPVIGILRGFSGRELPQILQAVVRGGLRNIEITMNSPSAAEQIRLANELGQGKLNVGAGTVTSLELLDQAVDAGASFIVTPNLKREVVIECVTAKVPIFPGAFSATEVYTAWDLGATMVKIFPADAGGPAYIRALRAPFPAIKLLPTGGVDLQTAGDFLKAGAVGLGVGSPLFDKQRIERSDWRWLEEQARRFVALF